jgi:Tfp pilus assembly protein PilN
MIKINLNKRRKKDVTKNTKASFDLKNLFSFLKKAESTSQEKKGLFKSPLGKAILALGAIYFVNDTITQYKNEHLTKINSQLEKVNLEMNKVNQELARLKDLEAQKKQLEEIKSQLRVKIEVLSQLSNGKEVPAKMLLRLSENISKDVWLTSLKVSSSGVSFKAKAYDMNPATEFLKYLSSSEFYTDTKLLEIKETQGSDESAQEFEITAQRRGAM